MTELKILHLAYTAQVNIWAHEHDLLMADINNKILKAREQKEWALLQEISEKLKEVEKDSLGL